MARKTTATKLVLTAIRRDGTEEFLSSRTLGDDEDVNLYREAKTAMEQRAAVDDENERRVCRNSCPRTLSVRADLKVNGQLVDRDEAH